MGDLEDVAARAARRYARRCWWAEEADLKQEALAAALVAQKTWDAQVGVPLTAYAWRAAVLALRAYLWRNSAPVSESGHRLHELKGVHRQALDTQSVAELEMEGPWVDELLDDERWRHRVREQIHFVLEHEQQESEVRMALSALLDDVHPRDVALTEEAPVGTVYRAVQRAKTALKNNMMLYDLLKEKK